MKCSKCNAEISDNAKFCPICGSKVEQESKCPNCGAIVSNDAKFCTKCGAKIGDNNCNNTQQYVTANNITESQPEPKQMSEQTLMSQIANAENNDSPRVETCATFVPPSAERTENVPILNNDDYSFDVVAYKHAISKIYNAVAVIFVLWVISVIISFIPYVNVINKVIGLVELGFYIYYIVCLSHLAKAVHENDVPSVKKLQLSSIIFVALPFIATICVLILSTGISSAGIRDISRLNAAGIFIFILFDGIIISIIALRTMCFEGLRKSETFHGRQGANTLYIATLILAGCFILTIISGLIGIGNIALYLILGASLVAIILTFVGWKRIKEAADTEISNANLGTDSNETGTIVCPNKTCGKEVSAKFKECPFCGTPLRSQE